MSERMGEKRRPNLATIVGSGLAAVAAGSLLAFSSLAEQAGLQGLATGGLQPAAPTRAGNLRAIRLPAPAPAAPGEPADPIQQIVRDAIARASTPPPVAPPAPRVTPGAPDGDGPGRPAKNDKPRHRRRPERPRPPVAVAARETVTDGAESTEGPPYGKAHGHDKHDKKPKAPKAPKHPGKKKSHEGPAEPVYARSRGDGDEGSKAKSKAPKLQKVKKHASPPGHAKGHSKGNPGKAKGHSKHAHDKGKGGGKGKGHSKHGH